MSRPPQGQSNFFPNVGPDWFDPFVSLGEGPDIINGNLHRSTQGISSGTPNVDGPHSSSNPEPSSDYREGLLAEEERADEASNPAEATTSTTLATALETVTTTPALDSGATFSQPQSRRRTKAKRKANGQSPAAAPAPSRAMTVHPSTGFNAQVPRRLGQSSRPQSNSMPIQIPVPVHPMYPTMAGPSTVPYLPVPYEAPSAASTGFIQLPRLLIPPTMPIGPTVPNLGHQVPNAYQGLLGDATSRLVPSVRAVSDPLAPFGSSSRTGEASGDVQRAKKPRL
ncbi:hypothetical protein CC1G_02602 [Coprinopsis cinerea okayama7|uniref:Uncharacterized protein n=1 Tax=Coprinopsis cinerea (strain Okayama-7 / 130 / ATCC MYA-4618 / FGSC 9003) TaxID=240176 RepID=A8PBB1_COPC7|nr:hypothetical protein CC1G_02602 [Coprinopsis cinerea okayama7\|eukprot:XP_001840139.1 hypothetical protein CC1G_02602 [Coprinopsis cinerea okayama7\